MTAAQDYPELRQFFGGYFHEEFAEHGETWEAVVDIYVRERSASRRVQALHELEILLTCDDTTLERNVDELGLAYLPDPLTVRDWLRAVGDRVAAGLTT